MKGEIVLINSSYPSDPARKYSSFGYPLGLLQIESALSDSGYSTVFIDPQIHDDYLERFEKSIKKHPVFVGFSTYLGENLRNAKELSAMVKRLSPETPVVWGGPFSSSVPEVCLDQADVDYVVLGMGEFTVVTLADYLIGEAELDSGSVLQQDSREGVLYRYHGKLDDLPRANLALWGDGVRRMRAIPILSSRGCPRKCSFCYNTFVAKSSCLLRSAESMISEMEYWSDCFGITTFYFVDDNFLINKKRAKTIFLEMKERGWNASRLMAHFDDFNDEILPLVYDLANSVIMCIESGSEKIQELLNKRIPQDGALHLIKKFSDHGVDFTTAFMFGLPGEDDNDIRKSIELAYRIKEINDRNISMCYIYVPQPKDQIISNLPDGGDIDFSLEVTQNAEVIPVPPNQKLDLRLRPWMNEHDKAFYLNLTPVFLAHFARRTLSPEVMELARSVYSRSSRIKALFRDVSDF